MTDVIDLPTGVLGYLFLAARIALVTWAIVAIVFCAQAPSGAFVAEGKWNKFGWLAVLTVAALLFLWRPLGFFGVIGIVAVGVFYADVRPAVSRARR